MKNFFTNPIIQGILLAFFYFLVARVIMHFFRKK